MPVSSSYVVNACDLSAFRALLDPLERVLRVVTVPPERDAVRKNIAGAAASLAPLGARVVSRPPAIRTDPRHPGLRAVGPHGGRIWHGIPNARAGVRSRSRHSRTACRTGGL